jgi:hypothetical protein
MAFKHKLGAKAKDKITGFEGIITARIEHITGCDTYWLTPDQLDKEGKKREAADFDEGRLEIIGPGILPEKVQGKEKGSTDVHPPRGV